METLFGALLAIVIIIVVEHLRSPVLTMSFEPPLDFTPRPPPFQSDWRSLRIRVLNQSLPWWANWWLLRLPAQQCRGEIAFLRSDATDKFAKPMAGRWVDSPEPMVVHVTTPSGPVAILTNPTALKTSVDIYPGETEPLDVAVRVEGEPDAYGWNDETYFVPNWRNLQRQLGYGTYLIEVTVTSSGRKCRKYFRLCNDGPRSAFCLAEPTQAEWQAINKRIGPLGHRLS
jgi:hypothetical protein